MTRNKVKLAWIVNDNARKSSFKKRNACLVKKMSELTTLCDISAFVIVYGEDGEESTVWPDRMVVEQLIARFQNIADLERWKKMMNQETYLKDRATKMQEQIRKIMKKNNELNTSNVLRQIIQNGKPLLEFDDNVLTGVVFSLEERMKEIRKRIDYFEQANPNHSPSTPSQWGGDQSEMISQIGSDFPESLFMYKDLGKQIQNNYGPTVSVRSDIAIPPISLFGNFTIANDMGMPLWNLGGNCDGSDLGLPKKIRSVEGPGSGVGDDMGVHSGFFKYQNYVGSDNKYGNYKESRPFWDWGVGGDGSDKGLTSMNSEGMDGGTGMELEVFPSYATKVAGITSNVGCDLGLDMTSYNEDTGFRIGDDKAGSNNGVFGHLPRQFNIGVRTESHRDLPSACFGGNGAGSDVRLLPGLFAGSNAGSDVGHPYNVSKSWQFPFSSP
ncbi:hypothetical protein ACFX2I_013393 [Malus domestica]